MALSERYSIRILIGMLVVTSLLLFTGTSAFGASTGSASAGSTSSSSKYGGYAHATWTWSGGGSVTKISLHVQDYVCDSDPVYAFFKIYRPGGGTWTTDTHRYDSEGCHGGGTTYPGLSLSDSYDIQYVAIVICIAEVLTDPCYTGAKSGSNPYV